MGSFEQSLSNFIHCSVTLVHLNISGMALKLDQYLSIAEHGLRKSRTLLSVHMSGLGLDDHQITSLRKCLNVYEAFSAHAA